MILLYLLGIILLIIILIIVIILLTPYTYIIHGDNMEMTQVELSVFCFFKRLGLTVTIYSINDTEVRFHLFNYSKRINFGHEKKEQKIKNKTIEKKIKNEKKKSNDKTSKKWSNVMTFDLIQAVIKLIKNIFKEVLPNHYFIDLKIGFYDPMYTGILYGLYIQFITMVKTKNIVMEPIFNQETLKFKVSIEGRIWLIMIIGDLLKFIISSSVRKQLLATIKN